MAKSGTLRHGKYSTRRGVFRSLPMSTGLFFPSVRRSAQPARGRSSRPHRQADLLRQVPLVLVKTRPGRHPGLCGWSVHVAAVERHEETRIGGRAPAGPRFSATMSLRSRSGTRFSGAKRRAKSSCTPVPGRAGASGTNRPRVCPSSLSTTTVSPAYSQSRNGARPSANSWMEAVFMRPALPCVQIRRSGLLSASPAGLAFILKT